MHSHRPKLKQVNKRFKGEKKKVLKGREVGAEKASKSVIVRTLNKTERNILSKQKRLKKREQNTVNRGLGDLTASDSTAPKVVVVVPFKRGLDVAGFTRSLQNVAESSEPSGLESEKFCHITFKLPSWAQTSSSKESKRQKLTVIQVDPYIYESTTAACPKEATDAVLDSAKGAGVVVCLFPGTSTFEDPPFDQFGYEILSALKLQGMPTPVGIMIGTQPEYNRMNVLQKKERKALLGRFFASEFGDDKKFFCVEAQDDMKKVLRGLGCVTPKEFTWRNDRGYLLSDSVQLGDDKLVVEGFARGLGFSVKHPIHITGVGDFILERISIKGPHNNLDVVDELSFESEQALQSAWDQLKSFDPLEGEQTWPTDEELQQAAEQSSNTLVESTAEDVNDQMNNELSDDGDHLSVANDDDDSSDENSLCNYEGDTVEKKSLFELEERMKEDLSFPDEVDTPTNMEAKTRFARYRGLRSFRTSPWDTFEELPHEYSRIFEFDSFRASMAFAKKQFKEDIQVHHGHSVTGLFIRLELRLCTTDPQEAEKIEILKQKISQKANKHPLIISTLYPYERKVTVSHFRLTKREEYPEAVPSKTLVEFQCGFRRSGIQTSVAPRRNDKAKYERTLPSGVPAIGSVYCPVMFPPAPILMFVLEPPCTGEFPCLEFPSAESEVPSEEKETLTSLAAWGSVLESDARRIIVKRIILTGYPFRVHKKKAVVRFMFFTPEDIRWFKPVELCSKKGLRGHIKEPLGTHGYMKCLFNNTVDQSDTICMYLYKRVYPKWFSQTWGSKESVLH